MYVWMVNFLQAIRIWTLLIKKSIIVYVFRWKNVILKLVVEKRWWKLVCAEINCDIAYETTTALKFDVVWPGILMVLWTTERFRSKKFTADFITIFQPDNLNGEASKWISSFKHGELHRTNWFVHIVQHESWWHN